MLLAIDLMGTALFAAEGASIAAQSHLDLLGILVLAFVTALGGGIVRDLLIGDVPPGAVRDWHYAATALAACCNPNASQPCSDGISSALEPLRFPGGPTLDVVTLKEGPPAVVTWRDWYQVVEPMCRLVERTEAVGVGTICVHWHIFYAVE